MALVGYARRLAVANDYHHNLQFLVVVVVVAQRFELAVVNMAIIGCRNDVSA